MREEKEGKLNMEMKDGILDVQLYLNMIKMPKNESYVIIKTALAAHI